MNTLYLGVGLAVMGLILIVIGQKGSRKTSVSASGGSVAVGGSNPGQIINLNVGSSQTQNERGHVITVVGIIVELAGITLGIWQFIHPAITR